MFAINEQFSKLSVNGYENILRFAQITLDSSERLLKHQFEQSKQALEANVTATQQLAGVTDPQQALAQINKLFTQSVEKAISHSRDVYGIVSQAQNELTALTEDSIGRLNSSVIGSLEALAKNAPAGSDVALNALKSSFAAATAAASGLTQAAQQVSEFTDNSIKAASAATSKSTAKRSS
jgi:phasin family protein